MKPERYERLQSLVTAKVRAELESAQIADPSDCRRVELPPLPDPNRYYQYDQQPRRRRVTPPGGPRAALPALIGNVTLLIERSAHWPDDAADGCAATSETQAGLARIVASGHRRNQTAEAKRRAMPPEQALYVYPSCAVARRTDSQSCQSTQAAANATKTERTWAVQVAAIAENRPAESLAQKLRRLGYHAYVDLPWKQQDLASSPRWQVGKSRDASELQKSFGHQKEYKEPISRLTSRLIESRVSSGDFFLPAFRRCCRL